MIKSYNKDTQLDFGMYRNFDLGIVYVFDPFYIEWCMINISWFFIEDINELKYFGVSSSNLEFLKLQRVLKDAHMVDGIDEYDSFQDLIANVDLGNYRYPIPELLITENFRKVEKSYEPNLEDNDEDYYSKK